MSVDFRMPWNKNSRRLGPDYVSETLREGTASPAVLVALRWIDAQNKHDVMRLYQVTDSTATFYFLDSETRLPMREFWQSMMSIFYAFPDLHFTFSSINEVKPGVVELVDYVGSGHHTGGKLEFEPHHPIPATGAYIQDEPLRVTITVKQNRVVGVVATSNNGGLSGPPGFYLKAKTAYAKSLICP